MPLLIILIHIIGIGRQTCRVRERVTINNMDGVWWRRPPSITDPVIWRKEPVSSTCVCEHSTRVKEGLRFIRYPSADCWLAILPSFPPLTMCITAYRFIFRLVWLAVGSFAIVFIKHNLVILIFALASIGKVGHGKVSTALASYSWFLIISVLHSIFSSSSYRYPRQEVKEYGSSRIHRGHSS